MFKSLVVREAIAVAMAGQPIAVAKVTVTFLPHRTATVLFGLERQDRPGSVEDVADVVTQFGASLNTIHTSRQEASGQLRIYGNLDIETGKIPAFRDQLRGFNEILYFKSIE